MKKILSIALITASAMSAVAAVNPDDYPTLELGKDYELTMFGEFKGKIVAPEDGQMIEYGQLHVYTLGEDGELQLMGYPDWQYAGYIHGKQAYQFSVTAGTTYFVYESFVMSSGTISFEMNPKVEVVSSTPASGEVFDVADKEFISLTFNQNVTIGSATLSCGTLSEPVSTRALGSDFSILVRDVMIKWYDSKAVTGGETLTLKLDEITDGGGNAVEPITLEYIAGYTPVILIDTKLPETIFSYMPESSDATKAVFTFSGPMGENPNITLCYSPIELGYEYVEPLTATVEGNTITVDFAGKLRVADRMSPTGISYPQFDLRLYSLRDARGQIVLSGEGMHGSYHLQVPFTEIPRLEAITQFTPENGADLGDATEISIYYNMASEFAYSGVVFSSGNEQVVVNKDELTVKDLGNNEAELTVAIPAGWASKSDVKVSLSDFKATDGYDHSAEFSAKYNGFVLTFVNPAAGSKLASLASGRTITVDSNLKAGSELTFAVAQGENVVYGPIAMDARAEGSYIHAMNHDVILYTGTEYSLVFTSGQSTESVTVYGTSAEFAYSPTELVSVSPEEGSMVTAGQELTLLFSGLVSIEALEESAPFTATTASEIADSGFDNLWKLTLGQVGETEVTVAFRAYDQDNLIVKGNQGEEAQSYFRLTYNTETGIVEISGVRPSDSAVYDLKGRRLNSPVHGINIINGKKVLVK